MTDNTYNGWTNWETWNINMWFDNSFNGMSADEIEEMVREHLSIEIEMGLKADFLNNSLNVTNWQELAEAQDEIDESPEEKLRGHNEQPNN